ncbi:MAG: hypothetical protein HOP19_21950 [Acidobacteria bacterium]|nr:hypothetical protein [Acidobacteriota bacterium]
MAEQIVIRAPEFDALVAYGIGGLAVLMAVLCIVCCSFGDRRRAWQMTVGFALLMGLSALAAATGWLTRFDVLPPPMLAMFVALLVISLAAGLSRWGYQVATNTSLLALIGLQSFRFPLELVMHHAANRAIMPVQLSYSGYNFDIVTGLGAVVLFTLLWLKLDVPRWFIWLWNLWGMYCLMVIVVIAVATSPLIRAFGNEPAKLNTWVLFFPYVWLPVVLVTIAITGHLLITRKLWRTQ